MAIERNFGRIVLYVIIINYCQSSGFGRCPRHPFMNNFNISKFAGHWYEIERSFYLMELVASCTTLNLTENSKGQLDVVVKSRSRLTGSSKISEGFANPSRRDPSVFNYRVTSSLPNSLSRYLPGAGIYQILDTDYDNFAILWRCSNFGLIHTDFVWILGRVREIDVTLRSQIYDFLHTNRIDSERLIIPKNSNCTDE